MSNKPLLIQTIQGWFKSLSIFWVFGFIVFLLLFVYPMEKEKGRGSDVTINLLLPLKAQTVLYNIYGRDDACYAYTDLFGYNNRKVLGKTRETVFGNTECIKGREEEAKIILLILVFGFVLLRHIIPWILSIVGDKYLQYKSGKKAVDLISEHNYLQAYKEIEDDDIQSPELWAKAFALSDGDKDRQQSIYVELRARHLDGR